MAVINIDDPTEVQGVLSGSAKKGLLAPAEPVVPPPKPEKKPEEPTDPNLNVLDLIGRAGQGGVAAAQANKPFDAALMQMNPPQLERPPKPKPENESVANAWGAAAMAFAMLMGRKSQTPVIASLNAAAGALQGLQEGKTERAREAWDRWKVENDNALKTGEFQLKSYHELIDKYVTGRGVNELRGKAVDAETKAKLDALSRTFENPAMLQAAASGDLGRVAEVYQEQLRVQQGLKDQSAELRKGGEAVGLWHRKRDAFKEQNGREPSKMEDLNLYTESIAEAGAKMGGKTAQGLTSPDQVERVAQLLARYDMAPPAGRTLSLPGWADAMIRAKEINPDYKPQIFGEIAKAMNDMENGMSSRALRSFGAAAQHLLFFQELANKLPNDSDVQTANAITAAVAKQFGEKNVTSFETARTLVGPEIAKAIVGGPTASKDREDIKRAFSTSMTREQLNDAIGVSKRLIGGQIDAAEEQHPILKDNAPQIHDRFFNKPWRQYFQPEKAAANAYTSTAKAPTTGEGSSPETPKHLPDMAAALSVPNGTWVADPSGEAIEMTDERRAQIKEHLGQ
jgi:hypothetical protein